MTINCVDYVILLLILLASHSDGSVNAWGYKMIVTPIGGESDGAVGQTLCQNADLAALEYFYLWELSRDNIGLQVAPQKSVDISTFEMKPASKFCSSFINTGMELAGGAEESKDSDADSASPCRKSTGESSATASGIFRVRTPAPAGWPKGYAVSEVFDDAVTVHSEPNGDSEVVLSVASKDYYFLATESDGEWLKVKVYDLLLQEARKQADATDGTDCAEPSLTTESEGPQLEGWVRLRRDDDIFLVRDDIVPNSIPELVVIPSSLTIRGTAESSSSHSSSTDGSDAQAAKHPMYSIDDGSATLESPTDRGVDAMDIMRAAKDHVYSRLLSAAQEGCVGYAHAVIAQWLARWPREIPFSVDHFGGLSSFLTYLFITHMSEEKLYVDAIANLKQLLVGSLKAEDINSRVLCRNLVSYAKSQLSSSNQITKIAPVSRGMVKVIETRHPYQDNMDRRYAVTLPGAKYLLLVFDERCATETNCDYLVVSDQNGNEVGGRLTGTVNSSEKNWPGVGNKPALRIEGESCTMAFHSDGGVVSSISDVQRSLVFYLCTDMF
jgi:hypothetical protein